MRVHGFVIVLLALVIGIVPAFTDCNSQGRSLTLQNGKTVPMKCHWTGRAEIAVAVPLAAVGALLAVNRRKQTRRALAAAAALLGLMAIALPVLLIGVCTAAEMICRMLMYPVLILAGILTIAVGVLSLYQSRGPEASA